MITIGEKIKQIREFYKLSQKDFGAKIGVSTPYLSELENNKKDITSKIIQSLNNEFNISSDWLLFSISEYSSQYANLNANLNANPSVNLNVNPTAYLKDSSQKENDNSFEFLSKKSKECSDEMEEILYSLNMVLDIRLRHGNGGYLSKKEYLQLKEVEDFKDKIWNLAMDGLGNLLEGKKVKFEWGTEMTDYIERSKLIIPLLNDKLHHYIRSTYDSVNGFPEGTKGTWQLDLKDFIEDEE